MKRYGNLWERICSRDNIELAAYNAIRGKGKRQEVRRFKERKQKILDTIETELRTETYRFEPLLSFIVHEPKRREIHYPRTLRERIIHHCMMNVIVPLMIEKFTADTYGSIVGRGLHSMGDKMHKALKNHPDWYYVQTDIHHFYPSIDHDILKDECRRIFKDEKLLRLMDTIIDIHSPGLAIGVFPSQYLANVYLTRFDHWVKEDLRIGHYFRYMDDMVFLVPDKATAHNVLAAVIDKLSDIRMEVKPSARIAPVNCGIDVCGYIHYPNHRRLRKSIKQKMKRYVRKFSDLPDKKFKLKLSSHLGWCKGGDCRNLARVVLGDKYRLFAKNMEYKRLSEIKSVDNWFGLPKEARLSVTELFDVDIILFEKKSVVIRGENKIAVRFAFPETDNQMRYFITKSDVINDRMNKEAENLPFIAKIHKKRNYFYFE